MSFASHAPLPACRPPHPLDEFLDLLLSVKRKELGPIEGGHMHQRFLPPAPSTRPTNETTVFYGHFLLKNSGFTKQVLLHTKRQSCNMSTFEQHMLPGADPGFDQGGPQIVTGLKLPFWGLSFVEFWCWGLIQGGAQAPGPPWIRPWLHIPRHIWS